MNWFYESGGQLVGPMPAAEFERLAAVGTIAPDTLVWREGMTEWQPRSSVGTVAAVGYPVSVALATPGLCQDCGGTFPAGDLVTIELQGDLGKPRPALVIQSDLFDAHPSVTVLPVTSELHAAPLLRITVEPDARDGLRRPSQVMVDKPQSVARGRIGPVFGRVDDATLLAINRALAVFLGLA